MYAAISPIDAAATYGSAPLRMVPGITRTVLARRLPYWWSMTAQAPPTYDVFLVLSPFRDNVAEFTILSRPLADVHRRHVHDAEGFYCPDIDTALVALRFMPRVVERWGSSLIHLFAGRAGLPMVIPDELEPEQRRSFFLDHLSRYTTYVQHYPRRDDSEPLIQRVVMALAEHISQTPRENARYFFPNDELPVYRRAG
jgi:hypothetical protein